MTEDSLQCFFSFQEAFNAFHNDPEFARKYMKAIHIGSLKKEDAVIPDIRKDFLNLRQTAEKMVSQLTFEQQIIFN